MTVAPHFIACGGLVFVTTKFPHGTMSDLIPPMTDQIKIGVEVDLRATFSNEYFVVVITNWIRPGHADPTEDAWDEKVRKVLQYVWDQMVDREIVDGPMPAIVKGHPLDMLPN